MALRRNLITLPPTATVHGKLDSIIFDAPKLHKAIRKIKTKSKLSCDPDGYPTILLFSLASDLTEPLSLIFNSIMSVGKIPAAWKTAIVTPFYKKVRNI